MCKKMNRHACEFLFLVDMHTGSNAREEEEQTMMYWINFLQEVEGMHLWVENYNTGQPHQLLHTSINKSS